MSNPNLSPEFLMALLEKTLKQEHEYFEIQRHIQELTPIQKVVLQNLPTFKLADQLELFRAYDRQLVICEKLAEKYGLEVPFE